MHKKSRKQELFRDGTKSNKSGDLPNKLQTTEIVEPIYDFQREMERMERNKKNMQNDREKRKREKSFLEKGLLKVNRNKEDRAAAKDVIKNEKASIEKSNRRSHSLNVDLEDGKKHMKISKEKQKNEINHSKVEPVMPNLIKIDPKINLKDEEKLKKEQRKQKSKYTKTYSLSPEIKEKSKQKMEKEDLSEKSELFNKLLEKDPDKRMLKPKKYKIPVESNNYELINKNTGNKQVKRLSKPKREKHSNKIDLNSLQRCKTQSANPEEKESESESQLKKVILERRKKDKKTRRIKRELNKQINSNLTDKEMEVLQLMDIRDNFAESESTNLLIEHTEKKFKKQKTDLDIKSMLITKMQKKLDFFLNKNQAKGEEPTEMINGSSEVLRKASDFDLHKKVKSSKNKKHTEENFNLKHKERVKPKLNKNVDSDSEKSKPSRTKIQKRRKKHRRHKESNEVLLTPQDPVQMFYFTIPKSNPKDNEKEKGSVEYNKLDKAEKLTVPEGEVEKHTRKKKHVKIDVPSCIKEGSHPLLTSPDIFHNLDPKDPRGIHLLRRIQKQRKKRMERTNWIAPILPQENVKTAKENDVDEVKNSMNCLREKEKVQPSLSPTPKISLFKTDLECRNVSIMAFPTTLLSKKSLRNNAQECDPIEKKMQSDLFKNYYEYKDASGKVNSDRIVVASDSNRIQANLSDPLDSCDIESSSKKQLTKNETLNSTVVVNESSPLDLACEAKINTILQELVGGLLTKGRSGKTNIKDIKRKVTMDTKDKKVYKYELTTYKQSELPEDCTLNYFSNTKFVEGSGSVTENEKVIEEYKAKQCKSRSLSPKMNKHKFSTVPPRTALRTKSPKCPNKNQPKTTEQIPKTNNKKLSNGKTTKPPSPPRLKNEAPPLNKMLKRSKSDVDILAQKEKTSTSLRSKSSGSLKHDEKTSLHSSANSSEKKSEKNKVLDLKPSGNRNASNSSKSPAVKNQKPKTESKVVEVKRVVAKENNPSLNRSKSELNPREASKAKDESQINSLIELDKFHKAKPKPRNRSLAGSLDRSLEKNASRMSSSLFLTKQYTGTKISAFQKRKSYDESIRRRLKKNPSRKTEAVPQQIFEVRFVTVLGNDTQSTNGTASNVIVNKVVPVTDGSSCNFVICCPNILEKPNFVKKNVNIYAFFINKAAILNLQIINDRVIKKFRRTQLDTNKEVNFCVNSCFFCHLYNC